MLFEPCGDLRRDYGAYCETLRLTEREDVYRALHTTAELARQEDELSAGIRTRRASPDAGDPAAASAAATTDTATEARQQQRRSSRSARASTASGRRGGGGGGKAKEAAGEAPTAASPTHASGATGDGAGAEGGREGQVRRPVLTFITMRHPTFCINQRDVTPLCRAMPHCPSLMSVQLVGCGLSLEAYMLLVEAVYKCRRVVSVEVDFNALPRAGFVPDPTVAAPTAPPSGGSAPPRTAPAATLQFAEPLEGSGAAAGDGFASSGFATHEETTAAESGSGAASEQLKDARRGSARRKQSAVSASKQVSRKATEAAVLAAATEAAAAALAATDEPGAIYLKPTEFCGLHTIPTPLEEQLIEEKEKKGKADAKKVAQLQAQLDAMEEFDRAHRLKVPRGWHGMLYTGLRHLSLRGNGIGDEAVGDIVDAVQGNPYSQLTTLNLWGNAITDAGAAHLARLLSCSNSLRALDLGRNRLSDAGVLQLVDCFRMREVLTTEELNAYRQAVLTRPSASEEERRAAGLDASAFAASLALQPAPPAAAGAIPGAVYPSYQDLYRVWHSTRLPAHPGPGGDVSGDRSTVSAPDATGVAAASSVSSGSGRRGGAGGAGKGKATKSEAPPPPVALHRPTTPFDRDCVRVLPAADSPVRVPGNTVLEVLHLGENALVTPSGAWEAARRLAMHEPRTDDEMAALAAHPATTASGDAGNGLVPPAHEATAGAWPPLNAAVEAPEPHCAGLRLRSLVVLAKRFADEEEAWVAMAAAQRAINAALDSWAPAPPSLASGEGAADGGMDANGTSAAALGQSRRQSVASTGSPSKNRGASRSPVRAAVDGKERKA